MSSQKCAQPNLNNYELPFIDELYSPKLRAKIDTDFEKSPDQEAFVTELEELIAAEQEAYDELTSNFEVDGREISNLSKESLKHFLAHYSTLPLSERLDNLKKWPDFIAAELELNEEFAGIIAEIREEIAGVFSEVEIQGWINEFANALFEKKAQIIKDIQRKVQEASKEELTKEPLSPDPIEAVDEPPTPEIEEAVTIPENTEEEVTANQPQKQTPENKEENSSLEELCENHEDLLYKAKIIRKHIDGDKRMRDRFGTHDIQERQRRREEDHPTEKGGMYKINLERVKEITPRKLEDLRWETIQEDELRHKDYGINSWFSREDGEIIKDPDEVEKLYRKECLDPITKDKEEQNALIKKFKSPLEK